MAVGFFRGIRDRYKGSKSDKLKHYEGETVDLNPSVFGKGLKAHSVPAAFIFAQGGVGDYINWSSAVKFIAETCPHVDGRIYVSGLFYDVAKYLFADLPRWKVFYRDDFPKGCEPESIVCFPKPGTQLINACGSHLMDLGFMYFACTSPPPKSHNHLIDLKFEGPWKWPDLDPKSQYAVFTPGSTTEVREMPVAAFNELVKYTLSKNITPVFLGKRELSGEYAAKFLNYDLTKGVDLRERTNLLEATQIMRGARFVIGIDNGLLHMAGTTDVPVIFGHNIATLEHRELRRLKGVTFNVTVPEKDLPCIGCQSKMRFVRKHDFRFCFFKDTANEKACLDHLFKDGASEWKRAIDQALEVKRD